MWDTTISEVRRMTIFAFIVGLYATAWAEPLFDDQTLAKAPSALVFEKETQDVGAPTLECDWKGGRCTPFFVNQGETPRVLREAKLFSVALPFPAESRVYGEGFTMLSQTGGTLGAPSDLGFLTDRDHYKLPETPGMRTVYGLLTIATPDGENYLFGFTSCKRFSGQFRFNASTLEAVIDLDGYVSQAASRTELEEFVFLKGRDRNALLREFAGRIAEHHPRLQANPLPTGWCSWYCYGPAVTEAAILANLAVIKNEKLPLRYIQIDDGYQAAMGDWLETGKGFGGGIDGVLRRIKDEGFEPAIWVAPFVAEKDSNVFREHPDWFIQDEAGQPLASDRITFGGWRRGPWYCLDGTHPGVQKHLEEVFRTMRERWGTKYFKLDALYWGSIRGGKFHDPSATRVEAYRLGMEALLRGAGPDSFILGCNHPMWPSLGLIHGSRSSMDVTREWANMKHIAAETFERNWQNDRLWWNDPDCVLLTGTLSEEEYRYHATAILASGGMILSGDNLTKIKPDRLKTLRRLLTDHPTAAEFEGPEASLGRMTLGGRELIAAFNAGDTERPLKLQLPVGAKLKGFWSGLPFKYEAGATGEATLDPLPPHAARAFFVERN